VGDVGVGTEAWVKERAESDGVAEVLARTEAEVLLPNGWR